MPFCRNCGAKLDESEKFCHSCGAKTGIGTDSSENSQNNTYNNSTNNNGQTDGTGNSGASFEEKAKQTFNDLNNGADITSEIDEKDVASNKGMGVLAYLSWLVLIPIFCAKNSKFARFHSNQGLVLAICHIALGIIRGFLGKLFLVDILCDFAGLILFVLAIIGIVNVLNGKAKEIPIIGSIKILN